MTISQQQIRYVHFRDGEMCAPCFSHLAARVLELLRVALAGLVDFFTAAFEAAEAFALAAFVAVAGGADFRVRPILGWETC